MMPGYLLQDGATVLCAHGGQAQPTSPDARVTADGRAVTTQAAPWTVSGCTLVSPAPGPDATAQFTTAANRIRASGVPVLLQDSQALCAPSGNPTSVVTTQTRVKGM